MTSKLGESDSGNGSSVSRDGSRHGAHSRRCDTPCDYPTFFDDVILHGLTRDAVALRQGRLRRALLVFLSYRFPFRPRQFCHAVCLYSASMIIQRLSILYAEYSTHGSTPQESCPSETHDARQ